MQPIDCKPSFTYRLPSDLTVIDVSSALEQVGNDRHFLKEVLDDFKHELQQADISIEQALEIEDYATIERAAHRVKGSASYLHCDRLREITFQLQTTAHLDGALTNIDRLEHIRVLFSIFKTCMKEFLERLDLFHECES